MRRLAVLVALAVAAAAAIAVLPPPVTAADAGKVVMRVAADPVGQFGTAGSTGSSGSSGSGSGSGGSAGSGGGSSFNSGGSMFQNAGTPLSSSVDPEHPHGPPELLSLAGQCFSKQQSSYRYQFCPFANATQHEISSRWNPYNGILGVFARWMTANNQYAGQHLTHGDACARGESRQVRVFFACGHSNKLVDVSEPATCQYRMLFKTPLFCNVSMPVDSMLYECGLSSNATLPPALQEQFAALNRDFADGAKGLEKEKHALLNSTSLCHPFNVRRKPTKEETEQRYREECARAHTTSDALTKQVEELQAQVRALQALLNSTGAAQSTNSAALASLGQNEDSSSTIRRASSGNEPAAAAAAEKPAAAAPAAPAPAVDDRLDLPTDPSLSSSSSSGASAQSSSSGDQPPAAIRQPVADRDADNL
ncbi:N-acetylglucosamine-1-phosphate transferase [Capsaspora owczarzaki ATCC 30864]|uniref:N-acetylglucosamine-1-phosphate transferase n=1 Tax=Capsaspora owczarzaki (strain ATCC 30864) TaxID=595528 RepID=A0A0D2X326_CAPO3|nr:N-acetylglucosamine-1-phosphate transferase [Capsaspora owczarzaki ATCC 30864]KJE93574.1 N-acetylglucosamine-1-phosphate transferase [Capsaspora owczarzaki ATCC 30864]|eukprot:XP_004348169.2 N-acetylglucosamine-1-phosphate transferase [Capsaspora owczarzaki ATCC 30864]